MSTIIMNNSGLNPPPHRKPVPGRTSVSPATSFTMQTPMPKQPPAQAQPYARQASHSRTRTSSSNAIPYNASNPSPPQLNTDTCTMTSQHPRQQPPYPGQSRRTLSNATSSTSSTNTTAGLQRVPTSSGQSTTSGVRRSTSSRSNGSSASPTSYVALMRKQKGTVWCDRAQHEDPRILSAQRQAKMRAAQEVAGGHNYATQVRTSTSSTGVVGGVRSKIRHHGAPKASAYNAAILGGSGGVPMRLSASEVDDGNDSDEETGARHHARNGSGRSSLGSGRRGQSYVGSNLAYSNGSTPPGVSPVDSMGDVQEEETPMVNDDGTRKEDYFTQTGGSGNSGEQEESFGKVGGLPPRRAGAEQPTKSTLDDLRRRGSVDERTMTMSGPRLFVANPDLSD
ncbi:Hypothetical predicted protein [Lecanosticta acicola]|uniref:Uncharacterized protein n=1 Tax=Lecanosticta acicola TaxID=111012 RepID=A0AAI8YZ13_9PEZI|nr:Hypothetical predicted protein [Lecanosticta acicola]